jgi:hypothetical protein
VPFRLLLPLPLLSLLKMKLKIVELGQILLTHQGQSD